MAMQTADCEAIVLGVMDYRESDRIVTLFTREAGKLRCLARGARKSLRRFGGTLELFGRLRVLLTVREGLSPLREATAVDLFPGIRGDLERIALAGYAAELVDRLQPEGAVNPRLYRLLAAFLEHLNRSPAELADRRFFEVNLLKILGSRPELDRCGSCGSALGEGAEAFLGVAGALRCAACGRGGEVVAPPARAQLRLCLATGCFGTVRFAPAEQAQAGALLDAAIAAHLERPLKSLAFLREVGG